MKATELTWKDVQRIVEIADEVIEVDAKMYWETPRSEEDYYTEILKRFNGEG